MIEMQYENDCVGCPQGCINCGRDRVRYYYYICDKCGEECSELLNLEYGQLCRDCADELLETDEITQEEYDFAIVIDDDNADKFYEILEGWQ